MAGNNTEQLPSLLADMRSDLVALEVTRSLTALSSRICNSERFWYQGVPNQMAAFLNGESESEIFFTYK